ncbi:MAG TPA: hypothetical protein VMV47_09290 [Bacteroidales bacterium]|nr:hypothetical protein [Bacteroidales bacterium]
MMTRTMMMKSYTGEILRCAQTRTMMMKSYTGEILRCANDDTYNDDEELHRGDPSLRSG